MAVLYLLIAILLACVLSLCAKVYLLKRSAREIAAFHDRLADDTNALIDISSRDADMRALASAINRELRVLRRQRNRYISGDKELREAITNISHDLRTPLTAICGYLDLIKRENRSEAVQRYLAVIEGRAEVMKNLTEELLRYSIIASSEDSLALSPIDIKSVLEEAIVAHYADLMAHRITPAICMPDENVVRSLNRDALSRVFGNLISNAIRYSDGDLSIELTPCGTITFSNTASHLDEVQVGKLFDRFYTVESARRSTGLGLSIAKILTEQMGGQIAAGYKDKTLTITLSFEKTENAI